MGIRAHYFPPASTDLRHQESNSSPDGLQLMKLRGNEYFRQNIVGDVASRGGMERLGCDYIGAISALHFECSLAGI